MGKVAAQAGKAAPAVAIAGTLVTATQAQQALAAPAHAATRHQLPPRQAGAHAPAAAPEALSAHAVTIARSVRARHVARGGSTYYKVRSGDTLSMIAERYYHKAADWQYLYHENARTITDPNLIYAGQTLLIPAAVPAHYTLTSYVPRHARPAAEPDQDGDDLAGGGTASASSAAASGATATGGTATGGTATGGTVVVQSASQGGAGSAGGLSGTLSCQGLERLWDAAGGNPADAFLAAEIAMAESGGNQYALSPTRDYGYWQINASNGSLATFSAYGNARSAIILSHDGTDWSPWTTYTSGAYAGRC